MKLTMPLLYGLATMLVAYPCLRVLSHIGGREPDPAQIFYVAHSGYFWRIGLATYVGLFAAVASAWLRLGDDVRWLQRLGALGVLLLIAQTIWLP